MNQKTHRVGVNIGVSLQELRFGGLVVQKGVIPLSATKEGGGEEKESKKLTARLERRYASGNLRDPHELEPGKEKRTQHEFCEYSSPEKKAKRGKGRGRGSSTNLSVCLYSPSTPDCPIKRLTRLRRAAVRQAVSRCGRRTSSC